MTGDTTPISDDSLIRLRRFAEGKAITARANGGKGERDWLDVLALLDLANTAALSLVSAEAERGDIVCTSCEGPTDNPDTFCDECRLGELEQERDDLRGSVEGLRAQLAERLRGERDLVAAELLTVWSQAQGNGPKRTAAERAAYDDAGGWEDGLAAVMGMRADALLTALRAAGGQEKPSRCEARDGMWQCRLDAGHDGDAHKGGGMGFEVRWSSPAAPVGGQGEPSDANTRNTRCPECRADPGDDCIGMWGHPLDER